MPDTINAISKPKMSEDSENPYGYEVGQTVKLQNGSQGRVLDIFDDSIEVLLPGGRTVTVAFQDARVLDEAESMADTGSFDPKTGLPLGDQLSEFEGDATQFGTPTQSTPVTQQPPRRGYSIELTGEPGRDWMAKYAWEALETVFPRDYPGDSSVSNYSGSGQATPAMLKVLEVLKRGSAVVKTGITSEDIAQTLVAKLAANRVPAQFWRITSEDLDEGVNSASYTPKVGDEVLWRHSDPRSKMMPLPGTVLAVAPGKVTLKIYSKRMIQDSGRDTVVLDLKHYTVMPKQATAPVAEADTLPRPDNLGQAAPNRPAGPRPAPQKQIEVGDIVGFTPQKHDYTSSGKVFKAEVSEIGGRLGRSGVLLKLLNPEDIAANGGRDTMKVSFWTSKIQNPYVEKVQQGMAEGSATI
jgi:hypothetical protein